MERKKVRLESIRAVCDLLREYGITYLTPKTFLLIKSNSPSKNLTEINVRFWKTIHDLLLLDEFDAYHEDNKVEMFEELWKSLKLQQAMRYVRFKMMSLGYRNPHFFMFPQRDLFHGALELLLAFSWVLFHLGLFDKYLDKVLLDKVTVENSNVEETKFKNPARRGKDLEALLNNLCTSISKLYFLSRSIHEEIMYAAKMKDELQKVEQIGSARFPSGLTQLDVPPSLSSQNVDRLIQRRVKKLSSAIGISENFITFFKWLGKLTSQRRILLSTKHASHNYRQFEKIENSLLKDFYHSAPNHSKSHNPYEYESEGEFEENSNQDPQHGSLDSLKDKIVMLKSHLEKYLSKTPNIPVRDKKKITELKFPEFVAKYLIHFSYPRNIKPSPPTHRQTSKISDDVNIRPEYVEMKISNLSDSGIPSMCMKEVERVEVIKNQIVKNLERERARNKGILEVILAKVGMNYI